MSRVIGSGIDPTTYTKKKKNSTTTKVAGSGVSRVNNPTPSVTQAGTLSPTSQATLQQAAAAATNPQQTQTPTLTLQQGSPLAGSTGTTSWQQGFKPTELTEHYKQSMLASDNAKPDAYEAPAFKTSNLTNNYLNQLQNTENSKPSPYASAYESTINELLQTIKDQKPFDVQSDANYNALYNQYAERYKAQAQRAMNEAMASANAQTGGYGSTYGQAAGQQAYDNTMQGMNDNNLSLLNLAYQIYADNQSNDYKKLNAYQNQDNTMYGRYRDDVGDWQTDRNYYSNQYQQNYQNDRSAFESDRNFDYGQYRDDVSDWQTDRNYNANQYWNSFQQDRSGYENDRSFNYGTEQDAQNRDDNLYQNAVSQATDLAKAGLPVPSYLTDRINQYNQKYGLSGDAASTLAQIAASAQAAQAAKSSGSGSGSRSKKSGSSSKSTTVKDIYTDDATFKKKYPSAGSGDKRNLMAQSEYESRYETVKNDAYEQAYKDAKAEGMIDAKAAFYARNRANEAADAWAKKMSKEFKIIGDM